MIENKLATSIFISGSWVNPAERTLMLESTVPDPGNAGVGMFIKCSFVLEEFFYETY